jgi:cytochrome P450
MTPSSLVDVDLADPQTHLDPDLPELWRRLRTESPMHWNRPIDARPGFWAVSRYADVLAVYKDNTNFTSETGNVLDTLLRGSDSAAGKMLAVTDGPRHREIRKLMLRSFAPRALAPVVEKVRERSHRLVVHAVAKGEFDLATDIADHIPINTIGDLMDVPLADRPKLVDWNTRTLSRYSSAHTEMDEWLARNEILLYFADLARARRRAPGVDVISALATGTVDGKPLSEDEIVFNCYSLILGADESSRMSSIGGILALAEHPDQWTALRDGDADLETGVEEVLRWTTPAMHFGRRAVTDTTIGEQPIAAGDIVTLWNSSANRDEQEFTTPSRFDLARSPNRHLTFGYGPHFCLGAFLGRVHVAAILDAVRSTVRSIEVLAPPTRLLSNFVYGYSSAPASFTG